MIIDGFDLFRYSIPLKSGFSVGGMKMSTREGYILRLTSESGAIGVGEIAPLPGFSKETLAEACEDIARLRFSMYRLAIPPHLEELSGGFEKWIGRLRLAPSVRFGFESAVLRLMSRVKGVQPNDLISESSVDRIESQGLLAGDTHEIISKAKLCYNRGGRTFKVKVGRGDKAADLAAIEQIRSELPGEVVIRADANRAWDFDTALAFLEEGRQLRIEYVEEPVQSWEMLEEICSQWDKRKHTPIALDEHLSLFTPESIPEFTAISSIIIKPSVVGLETSVMFERRAKLLNKRAVYSSVFETAVGLAMTASLAAAGANQNSAHGFDAHSWLIHDIPGLSVVFSESKISLSQFCDIEDRIEWHSLDEVRLG